MSDSLSTEADALGASTAYRPALMGTRHMASPVAISAAHAAFAVLEAGGNAVDAGVAAGIALGVLQPDIVSIAGVAPIMFYEAASEQITTISGLGRWPMNATAKKIEIPRSRHKTLLQADALKRERGTYVVERCGVENGQLGEFV